MTPVLSYVCSICNEPSTQICVFCTKDACPNHRCHRCRRCSDCCECEYPMTTPAEAVPAVLSVPPPEIHEATDAVMPDEFLLPGLEEQGEAMAGGGLLERGLESDLAALPESLHSDPYPESLFLPDTGGTASGALSSGGESSQAESEETSEHRRILPEEPEIEPE